MKISCLFAIPIALVLSGCSGEIHQPNREHAEDHLSDIRPADRPYVERIGVVLLTVDGREYRLDTFEKGYTDMTVINEQVTCRLKDTVKERSILIGLSGSRVADEPTGSFKPPAEAEPGDRTAMITLVSFFDEGDITEQFTLKDGTVTVTALNPKDGTFEATFEGQGGPTMDVRGERTVPFSGTLQVKFEMVQDLR